MFRKYYLSQCCVEKIQDHDGFKVIITASKKIFMYEGLNKMKYKGRKILNEFYRQQIKN